MTPSRICNLSSKIWDEFRKVFIRSQSLLLKNSFDMNPLTRIAMTVYHKNQSLLHKVYLVTCRVTDLHLSLPATNREASTRVVLRQQSVRVYIGTIYRTPTHSCHSN